MLLVYLILVAQFSSFVDPFLIVLAVPTGLVGVMLTLALTGTTLNIQSLMGVVMLQGMVVSNSILIVDFANVLRSEGHSLREAVAHACRIRLRPILMTSLATVVGLLPMAFKLETGSEAYAPLARVIIGGLLTSIVLTIFVVPAAYLLMYRRRSRSCRVARHRGGSLMRRRYLCTSLLLIATALAGTPACAQLHAAVGKQAPAQAVPPVAASQSLTLQQAEQLALQNHPQVQASGYLAAVAKAQVTRSALGVLSSRLRQHHRSESGKRQPHHRRRAE